MVVQRVSYFCPRIFSQPGMKGWMSEARELYRVSLTNEQRALMDDLPNYVGSRFSPEIFDQHPEMRSAVDDVVNYVLSNGNGDLVVKFNELSWQARLFHHDAASARGGGAASGIRLHLRSMPSVEDSTSLNEFFRAMLFTDPRYGGDPSRIDPEDTLPYHIMTPQKNKTLDMAHLVASWSAANGKATSRSDALTALLRFAGISDATRDALRDHWDRARFVQDARYFSSPRKRYRRPGVNVTYRISTDDISRNDMDHFTLAISHRGSTIVDGAQLEGLSDDARSMVAASAALWRFAYDMYHDASMATRFMLAMAEQDGRLGELLDIFVLRYPHLFIRFIAPLERYYPMSTPPASHTSWHQTIIRYYVNRFRHQDDALAAGYHIGARPGVLTDERYRRELVHHLITSIMPGALRREISQSYAELRMQIVQMILAGEKREAIWKHVDRALEEQVEGVEERANVVRRCYFDVLEASNLWNDDVGAELNYSLDNAIEDERAVIERSLTEILSQAGQETGLWHAAYERGVARIMRPTRIAFWREVKQFIGNDQRFSALRYDVMSEVLGWVPLDELPPAYRDFMRISRERVLDLHGGLLPIQTSAGKHLPAGAPFRVLVEQNSLGLNDAYTPAVFLRDVESLLGITLADSVMTLDGPRSVRDAYTRLVRPMLPWCDSAELPVHVQPLVRLLRESVMSVFGGRIPSVHPLTGSRISQGPLAAFIEQGKVEIKAGLTLKKFRDLLVSIAKLNRTSGSIQWGSVGSEFRKAYYRFVEGRDGWTPLKRVPARNRKLLKMLRNHVVDHFGGRLLSSHPATRARLKIVTMERFIREGELHLSNRYGGKKFRQDLEMIFALRGEGDGYVDGKGFPEGFEEAYADVMAYAQGWYPLSRIPAAVQPMVGMLRKRIVSVFEGRIPSVHPCTGKQVFPPTFVRFVREGRLAFYTKYRPADFKRDLRMMLAFERRGEVISEEGDLPAGLSERSTDCVTHALGWRALSEIPEGRRMFVQMCRQLVVEHFGGILPEKHPVTNQRLRNKTLTEFLRTGDVAFVNSFERGFYRMIASVMRLRKSEDGFSLVDQDSGAFAAFYERYVQDKYGWIPLEDIPEGKRALVTMLRGIVSRHFRWRLPDTNPVTGVLYGNSPLAGLIATGKAFINASWTTPKCKQDILFLLRLQKEGGAFTFSDSAPRGFDEAHADFVAAALRWQPLGKIKPHRRPLIQKLREHVLKEFGGRYPYQHPLSGAHLGNSNVEELVEEGSVQSHVRYSRERLRVNLISLLTLTHDEAGNVAEREVPECFADDFASYFKGDDDWQPLDDVPPYARDLVELMRDHATCFFAGAFPSHHPITGKRLGQLQATMFISSGLTVFYGVYGPMLLRDDLLSLYNLERRSDSTIKPGRRSIVKFDRAFQKFVAHELGWRPLKEVALVKRQLLKVVRREMIKMFGGRFPGRHPLYGTDLYANPVGHFIKTGEIKLRPGYGIEEFIAELKKFLLGVVRTKKGYKARLLPPYMGPIIERFVAAAPTSSIAMPTPASFQMTFGK